MIKPTQDYVLVKRIEDEEEKTDSGLILPNQGPEKYDVLRGKIKAVGPGRKLPNGEVFSTSVNKGDKVLYRQYAGHHVVEDEEDFWIINERDVVAVLD